MTNKRTNLDKHNLYLSHNVWGELKLHAFHERTSSSDIINFVVETFLKERPDAVPLSRHRSHNRDEDRLGRSVYFRPDLWSQLQTLSEKEQFSIASLIENLLAIYLGLIPQVDPENVEEDLDTNRYVKVGGKIFDLGENPTIIDVNTGRPIEKGH